MFDHNFFCMNWINVYYTLQHCCGHRIWTRDLDMFSVSILRTTEKTTNSIRCGSSEQTSGPNPLKLSLYRISKLVMTPKTYVHPTPTPFFLLYIPLNCHEEGEHFQYRKQGIKHIKVALYGLLQNMDITSLHLINFDTCFIKYMYCHFIAKIKTYF